MQRTERGLIGPNRKMSSAARVPATQQPHRLGQILLRTVEVELHSAKEIEEGENTAGNDNCKGVDEVRTKNWLLRCGLGSCRNASRGFMTSFRAEG